MEAVLALIGKALAALVGFFVALGSFFTPQLTAVNPPPVIELATTTAATTTLPTTVAASSTATTSALKPLPSKPAATPVAAKPVPAPSMPPAPDEPAAPTYSVEELNAMARQSLVNILCTTGTGGYFNPISGSGVIVDTRGIILTNAHVAQYFLLRDYPTPNNVQCVVRTGSPAQPRYTAELMYLPPRWVAANAGEIASSTPTGTGQHDFAFLRITGTTDPNGTLPASFPALPMDGTDPAEGDRMVLAAYPAGFLGGISISLNLYQTSAVATVGQLYAFAGEHVDLFSLGGTVVSQAGSSGGAVVNAEGKLQGLIVTEVTADTTAGRDLRAESVGHINRTLVEDGLGGILGLLASDPATFAASFNATIAPKETKALEGVLTGQ